MHRGPGYRKQIEIWKSFSVEKRLRIAAGMFEAARKIGVKRLMKRDPNLSLQEARKLWMKQQIEKNR
jgi:hypothetical protein